MNVILKTKWWTYVWLTILLARPAKTEALVFCCSLVVFFCLLLRAWCVKVRQSAVAGHSQTLEDFDRLSALAWGALAIWSVGSRGPWGHIQVKFVCEGRQTFCTLCLWHTKMCMVGRRAQQGWGQAHQTTLGLGKEVTRFICIRRFSKNKRLTFREPTL